MRERLFGSNDFPRRPPGLQNYMMEYNYDVTCE